MLIRKKKPKTVELYKLLRGDVFENNDDIFMLLEEDYTITPGERKCVNLSNGLVVIYSMSALVKPLKAQLIVDFEEEGGEK